MIRPAMVKRFIIVSKSKVQSPKSKGAKAEDLPHSDPRIQPPIHHIGQHVRDDVSDADDEDASLNNSIVPLSNSVFDEQQTQSWPAKNFFSDDCTSQKNS